ncbi:MAG: tetratricopeptide repeat protein [Legionellales bacterium]|jgi:tetratricopeptide (TPR) repeat protein
MPYRFSCDFSASAGNPKASLLQAFELSNNTKAYFHHLENNNTDYIHLGFAFLRDEEIVIDCYQVPPEFDLNAYSEQINAQISPKKVTFIQQTGPYPEQVEKTMQRKSVRAAIIDKHPDHIEANRGTVLELLDKSIVNLHIDNALQHRIHAAFLFGIKFLKQLKHDDALFFFDKAFSLYKSVPQTDLLKEVNMLSLLKLKATTYIEQEKFEKAQKIYENILRKITPRFNHGNSLVKEIILLLIKSLIEQKKFSEVWQQLALFKPSDIKISNKQEKYQHARLLTYFGFALLDQNQPNIAIDAFKKAKEYFEDAEYCEDFDYAMALLHIALHTFNTIDNDLIDNDIIQANVEFAFTAFSILLTWQEDHKIITESNNIGLICINIQFNDLALEFFNYSKQVLASSNIPNKAVIEAATLSNIALTYARLGKTNDAIKNYVLSYDTHPNRDVLVALAGQYEEEGRFHDAIQCLQEAYDQVDENSPEGMYIKPFLENNKRQKIENEMGSRGECASERFTAARPSMN